MIKIKKGTKGDRMSNEWYNKLVDRVVYMMKKDGFGKGDLIEKKSRGYLFVAVSEENDTYGICDQYHMEKMVNYSTDYVKIVLMEHVIDKMNDQKLGIIIDISKGDIISLCDSISDNDVPDKYHEYTEKYLDIIERVFTNKVNMNALRNACLDTLEPSESCPQTKDGSPKEFPEDEPPKKDKPTKKKKGKKQYKVSLPTRASEDTLGVLLDELDTIQEDDYENGEDIEISDDFIEAMKEILKNPNNVYDWVVAIEDR